MPQPRIRMFAGPNGSGKSTIIQYLLPHQIGAYLNADELEKVLHVTQTLDLSTYHPALDANRLTEFLKEKKRLKIGSAGKSFIPLIQFPVTIQDQCLHFDIKDINSYLAARIIDFIRYEFLELKISFTFETVMSHISKVEFLKQAQEYGFRTYLYYVATVDPEINIGRVHYRVQTGGHLVPEQKIRERYYRSLDLLMSAVEYSDRSFLFDNSSYGQKASFLAEIQSAEVLKLNTDLTQFPTWFVEKVMHEFMD